ncbi:MAG: GTP 3',8-cyclase MoaA [Candidatus Kapabacteria bacterium]|nr:GTP 3',8-cyclase MoaA [Candidatus Kapabacteria bacterium]
MNRLIDRYNRQHTYLRISVTDRCNLRCAYCMPVENMVWRKPEEILSFEEILRVARVAVGMGVEKIRVTGGEPLVRSGIEQLLVRLKQIPGLRTLAVTTNGVLLRRTLPAIRHAVDSFNISLDTFRPDRFRQLTRRDALHDTLDGIDAALQAGYRNLKINAVVMRGVNDDELLEFAEFTAQRPVAVRFIEFMPFAGNQWTLDKCVPMAEILERLEAGYHLSRIPDEASPISRDYQLRSRATGHQHLGTVGVIASMTQPFCSSCSRIRLTAEGKVMPCLHSPMEFDLQAVMRGGGDDAAIESLLLQAVGAKPKEHLPAEDLAGHGVRVMIQIGG